MGLSEECQYNIDGFNVNDNDSNDPVRYPWESEDIGLHERPRPYWLESQHQRTLKPSLESCHDHRNQGVGELDQPTKTQINSLDSNAGHCAPSPEPVKITKYQDLRQRFGLGPYSAVIPPTPFSPEDRNYYRLGWLTAMKPLGTVQLPTPDPTPNKKTATPATPAPVQRISFALPRKKDDMRRKKSSFLASDESDDPTYAQSEGEADEDEDALSHGSDLIIDNDTSSDEDYIESTKAKRRPLTRQKYKTKVLPGKIKKKHESSGAKSRLATKPARKSKSKTGGATKSKQKNQPRTSNKKKRSASPESETEMPENKKPRKSILAGFKPSAAAKKRKALERLRREEERVHEDGMQQNGQQETSVAWDTSLLEEDGRE